jgi:thioredoxin-dependent peroxiredoxin
MRLEPPALSIDFNAEDIYGRPVTLAEYRGKRVMLSFFRNAGCPFCNLRLYELTHRYRAWQAQGLEVIAVFSSPTDEVLKYVAKHPRPFRMIGDPVFDIYKRYRVERSVSAVLKALLFKLPRVIRGAFLGGVPLINAHPTLVPADFLVDEYGLIRDIWYGRDASDHIPLKRVDAFLRARRKRRVRSREQLATSAAPLPASPAVAQSY